MRGSAKSCGRAVNDLYSGYDTYRVRAGDRRIPIVVLDPLGVTAQE